MSQAGGVTITLELELRPEAVEPFLKGVNLQGATAAPGFRSMRMVQHKDDPARLLFVEEWASEADYRAYSGGREERGELEGLKRITLRTELNVWPNLVVSA